jgi:hypothetical protein
MEEIGAFGIGKYGNYRSCNFVATEISINLGQE